MVTRKIGIEFDVNPYEANELYFEEDDYAETNEGDLDSIFKLLYKKRGGHIPLSVTWELTNHCNFLCPFCYIHNECKSKGDNEVFSHRFYNIKNDIDLLVDDGMLICYLTGGECLLHPDFIEIFTYLKNKGVLVAVLTNGALLEEKHFELFAKYKPYKVEVSVYGINRTFVKKDSKEIANVVLNNILRLKENGINVIAKIPYNSCTASEFGSVREWCEKQDIPFYYSDELFEKYDGTANNQFTKNLPFEESNNKEIEMKYGFKKIFDCSAGRYSLVISYDGFVRPCFAFYRINAPEWNFDISDHGIMVAYNSMREKIKPLINKKLPYCKGCNNYSFCQECLATQCCEQDVEFYMREKCRQWDRNESGKE